MHFKKHVYLATFRVVSEINVSQKMLVRAKNNGGEWTGALLQTLEETLRMEKYENPKKQQQKTLLTLCSSTKIEIKRRITIFSIAL